MHVLLVEDDPPLAAAVRRLLSLQGWHVSIATTGSEAVAQLAANRFDIAVFDGNLPDIDGFELCRRLRAGGDNIPLLMLTARVSLEDRVGGLSAGADDYLVKPFENDELVARLRALIRRGGMDGGASTAAGERGDPERDEVQAYADLTFDNARMLAHRDDRAIELRRTECELLGLFLKNPGVVLRRATILREVWGHEQGPESNSLEVHVGGLRRKLEMGDEPRLIHTVRGVGYVLRESAP